MDNFCVLLAVVMITLVVYSFFDILSESEYFFKNASKKTLYFCSVCVFICLALIAFNVETVFSLLLFLGYLSFILISTIVAFFLIALIWVIIKNLRIK